jgi:hypothetical protein
MSELKYTRDWFRKEIQKSKDEVKTWPDWAQKTVIGTASFPNFSNTEKQSSHPSDKSCSKDSSTNSHKKVSKSS